MRASSDEDDIIMTSPVIRESLVGSGIGIDDVMGVVWKAGFFWGEGAALVRGGREDERTEERESRGGGTGGVARTATNED